MNGLPIRPGPGIPNGLVLPADCLVERFSRASGPGGQGVNTTDSRVELEVDLAACPAFTDSQRTRVLQNLAAKLTGTRLIVVAAEFRHQRRNRTAARERAAALIRDALAPPPPARRATKPTAGSRRRRLDAKTRRSRTKQLRSRPGSDD